MTCFSGDERTAHTLLTNDFRKINEMLGKCSALNLRTAMKGTERAPVSLKEANQFQAASDKLKKHLERLIIE